MNLYKIKSYRHVEVYSTPETYNFRFVLVKNMNQNNTM
jgi:hypothetical protein